MNCNCGESATNDVLSVGHWRHCGEGGRRMEFQSQPTTHHFTVLGHFWPGAQRVPVDLSSEADPRTSTLEHLCAFSNVDVRNPTPLFIYFLLVSHNISIQI